MVPLSDQRFYTCEKEQFLATPVPSSTLPLLDSEVRGLRDLRKKFLMQMVHGKLKSIETTKVKTYTRLKGNGLRGLLSSADGFFELSQLTFILAPIVREQLFGESGVGDFAASQVGYLSQITCLVIFGVCFAPKRRPYLTREDLVYLHLALPERLTLGLAISACDFALFRPDRFLLRIQTARCLFFVSLKATIEFLHFSY
jgi:hypothetical protein